MPSFDVDCQLFLYLTGRALGDDGLYSINGRGVSAARSPAEIAESCPGGLSTEESMAFLDFARDAALEFPAPSAEFFGWLERNKAHGFEVPDWCQQVHEAAAAEAAGLVLSEVLQSESSSAYHPAEARDGDLGWIRK